MGTQGQDMWMLLDTGGSYTWVFGSDCTSRACQEHNTFRTGEGQNGNEWRVGYGTGTVRGTTVTDVISVPSTGVKVNTTFGLAREASDDFLSYPMDGILGLGPTGGNNGQQTATTFMNSVRQSKLLKSNVIGFSISRALDGGKDGEVTFGGVDESKFSGRIAYTDAENEAGAQNSRLWRIPLDDASVDGKACGLSGRSAIIDTGTSYVMAPPDDARNLHDKIPGASPRSGDDSDSDGDNGYYVVPCHSQANVQLNISGISYSISPKDYIGQTTSDNNCMSTIIGQKTFGDNDWLVGDTFLKNVYTVFDYDRNRVGFAPRGEGGDASPSPTSSTSTTESFGSRFGSKSTSTSNTVAPTLTSAIRPTSTSTSTSADTGSDSSATTSDSSPSTTSTGDSTSTGEIMERPGWKIVVTMLVMIMTLI